MSRLEEAAVATGLKIVGSLAPMAGLEFQHTRFFWNWQQLAAESRRLICGEGETLAVVNTGMSFAGPQRNEACRRMWGDWLFMVDTDMLFAPDTLDTMLRVQKAIEVEQGDCGVLVGPYPKRSMPPDEILLHHRDDDLGLWHPFEPGEIDFNAPGRCDAAGAGCMLVMRWVIERIVLELNVPPFLWWGPLFRDSLQEPIGAETEDLAFCERLRLLDPPVQLWYTTVVKPAHLSMVHLTTDDWLTHKAGRREVPVQIDRTAE